MKSNRSDGSCFLVDSDRSNLLKERAEDHAMLIIPAKSGVGAFSGISNILGDNPLPLAASLYP